MQRDHKKQITQKQHECFCSVFILIFAVLSKLNMKRLDSFPLDFGSLDFKKLTKKRKKKELKILIKLILHSFFQSHILIFN